MAFEIDLRWLFKVLRKHLAIMVGIPFIAIIISGAFSLFVITPIYEASTSIMLRKADDSTFYYETFVELAMSEQVIEVAIDTLHVQLTPQKAMKSIRAFRDGHSEIIRIKVRNSDPSLASALANQIAITFVQEVRDVPYIRDCLIMDKALVPKNTVSPNLRHNLLIASVCGVVVAFGLVLLIEFLDNTFKTPYHVEQELGLKNIGVVPFMGVGKPVKWAKQDSNSKGGVAILCAFEPAETETYSMLRFKLQYLNPGKALQSIAVTSAICGEGKTTTATNLARAYAQAGNKVLLVDGNLRNPCLHNVFPRENTVGFSSLLTEQGENVVGAIKQSGMENLDILTSGPLSGSPVDTLSQKNAAELFLEFKNIYDIIIIDCPAFNVGAESMILAALADGALFVVGYGIAKIDQVKKAAEQFKMIGVNIFGSVLNGVPGNN